MAKGPVTCVDCGAVEPRRGAMQKFCVACSEKHDKARKERWAEKHGHEYYKSLGNRNPQRKSVVVARGAEINKETVRSLTWADDEESEAADAMRWVVRFSVPFSYAFSKNHKYALLRRGHIALGDEYRAARQMVRDYVALAVVGKPVVQAKVWVDILVQKPDHRGDAINVIELIADAIKVAMGVDDRWMCIRRLDWQIVKYDPQVIIGIGQSASEDHQVCSHCGRVLPLTEFNVRRDTKLGVGRVCRRCRTKATVA